MLPVQELWFKFSLYEVFTRSCSGPKKVWFAWFFFTWPVTQMLYRLKQLHLWSNICLCTRDTVKWRQCVLQLPQLLTGSRQHYVPDVKVHASTGIVLERRFLPTWCLLQWPWPLCFFIFNVSLFFAAPACQCGRWKLDYWLIDPSRRDEAFLQCPAVTLIGPMAW